MCVCVYTLAYLYVEVTHLAHFKGCILHLDHLLKVSINSHLAFSLILHSTIEIFFRHRKQFLNLGNIFLNYPFLFLNKLRTFPIAPNTTFTHSHDKKWENAYYLHKAGQTPNGLIN